MQPSPETASHNPGGLTHWYYSIQSSSMPVTSVLGAGLVGSMIHNNYYSEFFEHTNLFVTLHEWHVDVIFGT